MTSPVPNYGELANYEAGRTTDWIDDISTNALVHNHNVAVMGGTESVRYYVSADYMDQEGVLHGYQYKRYGCAPIWRRRHVVSEAGHVDLRRLPQQGRRPRQSAGGIGHEPLRAEV